MKGKIGALESQLKICGQVCSGTPSVPMTYSIWMLRQNHHQAEITKSNHHFTDSSSVSLRGCLGMEPRWDGAKGMEPRDGATNKAHDRAHSLEVRGQTGLHSGSHKIALCSITVMINYIYVTQFEK